MKNLSGTYYPLPLLPALKKRSEFFSKQFDFHAESFEKF